MMKMARTFGCRPLTNQMVALGASMIRSQLCSGVRGHCSWLGRGEMGKFCYVHMLSSDFESLSQSRAVRRVAVGWRDTGEKKPD